MALIINNVTIPTSATNTLFYNNVAITKVIYNNVEVYNQSTGGVINGWSGSTFAPTYPFGIETSGFAWRARAGFKGNYYGPWQTVSSDGIFSGNSINYSVNNGIVVSGSNIRPWVITDYITPTWATYNVSTKAFTGIGKVRDTDDYGGISVDYILETSGGLIRAKEYVTTGYTYASSSWISLT